MRNDKLASAKISMILKQTQFKQVSSGRTTSQIWKRLQEINDESAESKASEQFLKFIHIQKKSTQSMKSYLDNIVELSHDLRTYNIDLSELAVCVKALDGLPDSYKQIRAAAWASQVITIPKLANLLLSSERDEKNSEKNSEKNLETSREKELTDEIKVVEHRAEKVQKPKSMQKMQKNKSHDR